MADLSKKLFWRDVRKNNWPKPGKFFIWRSCPASQSIKRGRISREGALDVRESRERRDKIVPKSSPAEKQEKRNFGLKFSFFWAGSLVVRGSRHRRDILSDKNSRKKEKKMGLRFIFQKSACASRFLWGIFISLTAEKLTFGRGNNFKIG